MEQHGSLADEKFSERAKRMNAALPTSEEWFHELFETSPVSLWVEDCSELKHRIDDLTKAGIEDLRSYLKDHPEVVLQLSSGIRIVDANATSLKIYGAATKEELIHVMENRMKKRAFHDFIERIAVLAEGGVPEASEGIDCRIDGTEMYSRITVHIPEKRRHDWSLVIAMVEDITERKKAEKALRESETLMRAILDNAPIEIYLKDSEGRYLQVNRLYETRWGVTNTQVRGKLPIEVHEEKTLATESRRIDLAVLESGQATEYDINAVVNGSLRKFHTIKFPIVDILGAGRGLGAVTTDVTEKELAQEALRESESLLRTIMDNAPVEIFLKDKEGRYLQVNRVFESHWGVANEQIRGKFSADVCDEPAFAATSRRQDLTVLETGKVLEENSVITIDGDLRTIHVIKFPIRDVHGAITGLGAIATDVTEQNHAQEALRESETRLRAIMDNAPVEIFLKDNEGRYLQVNRLYETRWGVTNEQARGELPAAVHGETSFTSSARQHDLAVLKSGKVIEKDYASVKDGDLHTFHTIKFPIRDAFGASIGLGGIATEVTEQKRAQEALRESEALMRQAAATADLGHWVWDEVTDRCVYCSETLAQMNEVTVEEYIEKYSTEDALLKEVHPNDRDRYAQVIREARSEKRAYDIEFRDIGPSGKLRHLRERGEPLFDENGELVRTVGTLQDVTKYKQTEEALRESERRYRDIFENAVEGIYRTAPGGQYISINPALMRMHGCETLEEFQQSFAGATQVYADPATREEVVGLMRKEGFVQGFECEALRRDGSVFWMSESGRAVLNNKGQLVGYEGFVEDITERKLIEGQLRQAQKLEALGRLTGGVAHEFNNQLFAINGFARLLENSDALEGKERRWLENVIAAAEQASSLTKRLLVFSHRQSFAPIVVAIGGVVQETERLLKPLIGGVITTTFNIADAQACVKVDPGQLSQALLNLAINARDAMPGGGTLAISSHTVDLDAAFVAGFDAAKPGPHVAISVADSGLGMNENERSHIFEPFYTTKEVGTGTGLGLSMVYGMVRQSGGMITVDSKLGQGSVFTIYLPQVAGVEMPVDKHHDERPVPGGSETILIVEDEPRVRQLTRTILENAGYRVFVAGDGKKAIDIFHTQREQIDLLLADIRMPTMGGRHLARELIAEKPSLKVLYMTGYDCSPHDIGKDDHGEDRVILYKPFEPAELNHTVRALLDAISYESMT